MNKLIHILSASIIFCFCSTPLSGKTLTINLMWLNKDKVDADYLVREQSSLDNLCGWAEQNPTALVHLWFDGKQIEDKDKATRNTLRYLENTCTSGFQSIVFSDLRKHDFFNKYDPFYTESIFPVLARADLARLQVLIHLAKQEPSINVYADLDIHPLPTDLLLDRNTKEFLEQYGFVMAKVIDMKKEPRRFYVDENKNDELEKFFTTIDNPYQYTRDHNEEFLKHYRDYLESQNIMSLKGSFENSFQILTSNPEAIKLFENIVSKAISSIYKTANSYYDKVPEGADLPDPIKQELHAYFAGAVYSILTDQMHDNAPVKPIFAPRTKFGYGSR